MFSIINIGFAGKYDKGACYVKLCSIIQACLIEIVFDLCLEVSPAPDILIASIHPPSTTTWLIETYSFFVTVLYTIVC